MDLTILITVMNRHYTLPRALEYYREFEGDIILLDQSDDPWDKISEYSHVKYIYLPNSDWLANMCHALNQVTTKYTIVVGDDDFVMLNNIGDVVSFLEQHPDHISASGQQITMEDTLFRYETFKYLIEREVAKSNYLSVLHKDPSVRMEFYWSLFNARNHSIITTQVQREIYRLHSDYPNIYTIRSFDKTLGLMLAAKGEIITLPIVSIIRSFESKVRSLSVLQVLEQIRLNEGTDSEFYNRHKPELNFSETFMDMELDPLLSYLNISRETIVRLFESFNDNSLQDGIYQNICETQEIYCKSIIPVEGKLDKSYVHIYEDESNLNEQKFLFLRPEDSHEDYIKKHSATPDLYEDVFPVFKKENIDELSKIYSFVENYPLAQYKEKLSQEHLDHIVKKIHNDTHPPYQNIIITGGLGHIGSFLIKNIVGQLDLIPENYNITVVDNMLTSKYNSLMNLDKNIRFIQSDFLDIPEDILKWADVIIHLAAITDASNPDNYDQIEKINVEQTKLFIDKCIKHSDAKFIFPSSTSVYGVSSECVTEDDDSFLNPQSPYAESKIEIEKYLEQSTINYSILRLGTIFGISPGMRFHTAINKFCYQAATGVPLTIWKENYDQYRPYLGLADLLKALMFAFVGDTDNKIFNVITDNYKLSSIVDMIKKNKDVELSMINTPLLNQYSYKVDGGKIENLGYCPTSKIDKEITNTIKLFHSITGT
tara:strand:+ start:3698 stop:5833 length:2136 start_codon:yes stop_codon:yes gene_type:complete